MALFLLRPSICMTKLGTNAIFPFHHHHCRRSRAYISLINNVRHTSAETDRRHEQLTVQSRLKNFLTLKYLRQLSNFDERFKESLPNAHRLFKLFKNGILEFFRDIKEYYNVSNRINSGVPLSFFTCKQLFLYQQMPEYLLKSAPLIISLPVPLAQYIVFPFAYYMYPKYMLSPHFWSEVQKISFSIEDLQSREYHHIKILAYLENHVSSIHDTYTKEDFCQLLRKIKQGDDVDVGEILKFQDIFTTLPFGLQHLMERHKIHLWHLCQGLEISSRRSRIMKDLNLIRSIDLSMQREGLDSINSSTLKDVAMLRGINVYNTSEENIKSYLTMWIQVSMSLDESSYSMLLHLPVLLSSCHNKSIKTI